MHPLHLAISTLTVVLVAQLLDVLGRARLLERLARLEHLHQQVVVRRVLALLDIHAVLVELEAYRVRRDCGMACGAERMVEQPVSHLRVTHGRQVPKNRVDKAG